MLRVCFFLFSLFLSYSLLAQDQSEGIATKSQLPVVNPVAKTVNENGLEPRFLFDNQPFDYGKVALGSNGLRSLRFKNTGDKPLIIHHIKSSCGCTIPKKPENPVLPGERDSIMVRYDTNRPGFFQKSLKIHYNHSTDSIKRIFLKGTVITEKKIAIDNEESIK